MGIALALYREILFVISCIGRLLAGPVVVMHDKATAAVERGGLSQASIAAIPAFVYGAAAGDGEAQCAVCLEAFMAGDRCMVLPRCEHGFHAECVGSWLRKSRLCPICRAEVAGAVAAEVVVEVAAAGCPLWGSWMQCLQMFGRFLFCAV